MSEVRDIQVLIVTEALLTQTILTAAGIDANAFSTNAPVCELLKFNLEEMPHPLSHSFSEPLWLI